jgi:hypothetical protein
VSGVRRVIAYDPITEEPLGELTTTEMLKTVRRLYGTPQAEIRYPVSGVNRSLLENPVEIGIERIQGDKTYKEYRNSRYLLTSTAPNDDYTEGVSRSFMFSGMRWRCSKAIVFITTPSDQPDGTPVEPKKVWINKNPGQILGDVFTAAQARGMLTGMTKDWGFAADSAGQAWLPEDNIPYLEVSPLMTFEALIQIIEIEKGLIEVCTQGRKLRVFRTKTELGMYRDLTVGDAPTGFLWGVQAGITQVTQEVDYSQTTTDLMVKGADGRLFTPHNFGSDDDAYYGPTEGGLDISWAYTADDAHTGADSIFRGGAKPRRQITIKVNFDSSIVEPDKDVQAGDRVIVQKDDSPKTPGDAPNKGEQRIIEMIEIDDKMRHGSFTVSDKLHRLEFRTAAMAMRIAGNRDVSSSGLSRPPQQSDRRTPTAPLTFSVTPSNYADANGKQTAGFAATWTDDGNAVPDPVTGQINPLARGGYELQYQSSETGGDWQTYRIFKPTATSGTIKGLPATATGYMFRLRIISFTFIGKSDWYTTGTITVPTDSDVRTIGGTKAYDAGFVNADIQAKRTAASGSSGLTWPTVSGRVVAQIGDTTAVLMSGVAGTSTSGRITANGGEKWIVGGTGKRVGGTAATIQFGVRSWTRDGTATLVANVASIAATTTDQSTFVVYTMPPNTVEAEWRARMTSPSGGAVVQVHTPIFDRQASTGRVEVAAIITDRLADEAVVGGTGTGAKIAFRTIVADNSGDDSNVARTLHPTDNLTTKHASTGALIQGSSGTSQFKTSPAGSFHYSSGTLLVEFNGSTVTIDGELIAGGVWIHDDVIEFDPGFSIAYDLSGLIYDAPQNVFTGNILADDINATGTLESSAGFGCNGAAPQTSYVLGAAIAGGVGPWQLAAQTLLNNLRTMSINNGTGHT